MFGILGLLLMPCLGLRVLIVEDEPIVADAMEREMRDAGCALVLGARDVERALEIVASTAIDAAILDVDLAGRHVWPVAAALDALGVPFVLMTNYATLSVPPAFEGRSILARPLRAGSLALAIDRAVAEACAPRATPLWFSSTGRTGSAAERPARNTAVN